MSIIKSFTLIVLIGIAVAGLSVSSARAAIVWNFVGGQLLGAQNVIVNIGGVATSFDVAFGDGSCITLYTGCNEASDFAITTLADATSAAQALLDQVFINSPLGGSPALFDKDPELINGCERFDGCSVVLTYAFTPSTLFTSTVNAFNGFNSTTDFLLFSIKTVNTSDFSTNSATAAVFSPSVVGSGISPVPLPAALPLFGSALAMLGIVGWRRKRRAAA